MQDVVFNFPAIILIIIIIIIITSPSGLNIKRNAKQTTLRSAAKPTREVLLIFIYI